MSLFTYKKLNIDEKMQYMLTINKFSYYLILAPVYKSGYCLQMTHFMGTICTK